MQPILKIFEMEFNASSQLRKFFKNSLISQHDNLIFSKLLPSSPEWVLEKISNF